jgi:hypothetical protein
MPCLPQQFCENISKNVQQAESAAAAMQAVAHAHAYQHAAVQAALGINLAADGSSGNSSSGNTGIVEHDTVTYHSSSSGGPLPLGLPRQVMVAGQAVAAAEQAHSAPVSLPPGISPSASTPGSSSTSGSSSGGGSGAAAQTQDKVVLTSWTAAALTGNVSGSSAASMGSREYDPAPGSDAGDSSESAMYWPSSVGSGAIAGDSEDF